MQTSIYTGKSNHKAKQKRVYVENVLDELFFEFEVIQDAVEGGKVKARGCLAVAWGVSILDGAVWRDNPILVEVGTRNSEEELQNDVDEDGDVHHVEKEHGLAGVQKVAQWVQKHSKAVFVTQVAQGVHEEVQ